MKSPISSGKPRKPKLLVRRVAGRSMEPALRPGKIVFAWSRGKVRPGRVVIFRHHGYEKIKRVQSVEPKGVVVGGDNRSSSTDSREYGPIPYKDILAVVIWPRVSG